MTDKIKVAVRIRPLITSETKRSEKVLWKSKDGKCITQIPTSEVFCFDRVFDPKEDNKQVYDDLCLPIVESVMQGFNGTVFAYGQTSSGKTFTMMGEHNGIQRGIIHYAIEDIFSIIQEMPDREFLLRVSFLEIYKERVYDLLSGKNDDLKLLEDSYGNIKVSGLQEQIVQTEEQILQWMCKGQKNRSTGETQMNEFSSRSHSIFRMIIESRIKDQDAAGVNVSQLNLVDLAGSENMKQTNSKERSEEGKHINLTLSALITVIRQLSERQDKEHISYRDSKLTRLLQNSLGGNACTAIICAITPASMKETKSTLNFAKSAKKIENKPMKNEIMTDQALLKQYANQIKKLSQELQVSKEQGKELEEKTKQNEKLKRQISALKANFVSQTAVSKSSRRETWGGRLHARHMRLESIASGYPSQLAFNLPTVEEELEYETSDINMVSTSSSIRASVYKSISDAEIQTEPACEPYIDYEGCMTLVSELKTQLQTLQCQYIELQTFTTLEKQHLKAESELQTENSVMSVSELKTQLQTLQCQYTELQTFTTLEKQYLKADNELQAENEVLKNENCVLRERLNSVRDKIPAKSYLDSSSSEKFNFEFSPESSNEDIFYSKRKELSPKECQTSATQLLMVKELEAKYEKESAEMKKHLEEAQSKSLQEKNNELEECNRNFEHKIIDLDSSYHLQIQALEAKLELVQSELKTQLLTFKELEAKYEKEAAEMKQQLQEIQKRNLQAKIDELEECNRDFREKIIDLEASHHLQVEEIKAKLELSQTELNKKSLLIKELEARCLKESARDPENYELCAMKHLQEKVDELEQCNKNLRRKISDTESSHSVQNEALEAKLKLTQSELETQLLMVKELETKYEKETAEMKHQLGESHRRSLQGKSKELEECNRDFSQKMIDFEASHRLQVATLEAKLELSQSELDMKSLLIKEFEAKYINKSAKDTENHELCNVKHLQEKANELEQCNRNLRQKISDLEAHHFSEIQAAKCENVQCKLLLTVKEALEKELATVRNQLKESEYQKLTLQAKSTASEMCCSKLKQQIVDLEAAHYTRTKELEENFETERSEYRDMALTLVKNVEVKCSQELSEQEQKITDRLKAAYSKRMEVYIKEACELREEMKKIRTQNQELINHKQQHLERIKQLEDKVYSESLEKVNLVLEVKKERERDLLASREKYESIISEYRKKQRQCKDINRQLQIKVSHYMEEIEKIKKDNQSGSYNLHHLKDNINSLTYERDSLFKKYTAAKQKISDFEKNQKESYSQKMLVKDDSRCKDLEESNKLLQLKLDQRKAEIKALETNNANMIQEIKTLRGELSSKVLSCKCKMSTKGSESDTPGNIKENSEIGKLEEETDAVVQQSHLKLPSESKPKLKRPEVAKCPVLPFQERNSEIMYETSKTPLQQHSNAVPRILGKQALKDKTKRKSLKPYDHPPKLAVKKELDGESTNSEMKENRQNNQANDAIGLLYEEAPECVQQ